jgi:hypothetical protein
VLSSYEFQTNGSLKILQPLQPTTDNIVSDAGITPEDQNQLRLAVEQLKQSLSQCLGEEHHCKSLIAEIESTISDIEQKTTANSKTEKVRVSKKKVVQEITVQANLASPASLANAAVAISQ